MTDKPSLTTAQAAMQLNRNGGSWSDTLGTPTPQLTFGFLTTVPTNYVSTSRNEAATFFPFSEAEKPAARLAVQLWMDVANINFTETTASSRTIDFARFNLGVGGLAWNTGVPVHHYVWVTSGKQSDWTPSGQLFQILLHEFGHQLGLAHPSNYDSLNNQNITYESFASYAEDNFQYTVMSYFRETNTGASYIDQNGRELFPETPMLHDIAAVQRLYGANLTTRTGDTVYGFNSNADRDLFHVTSAAQQVVFTVWDAGGTDTFDFSGYSTNQVIDLQAEHFSNVGTLTRNVAIAANAVIENAIGGSGNDIITGNAANNVLRGGGGNDTIDGREGIDNAVFPGPRSAYTITDLGGGSTRIVGPDGTDTLFGIERLVFDDQAVIINDDPPAITSNGGGDSAAFSISENTNVLTTVAANDPNPGNTITFAIVGGADGSRFQINPSTGVLIFLDTPDFESPSDSDRDNAYVVQVNASDGLLTDTQTITINVADVNDPGQTLVGNGAANTLVGGNGGDLIDGAGGNDNLSGGFGADVMFAGAGDDFASGGAGNDTILGQDGNDTIGGDSGDDHINGGLGNDVIFGGTGNDEIGGGSGNDILVGQDGDDVIFGEDGFDVANGGAGADVMLGGLGNDTFGGGSGNDIVVGGDGDDLLFGEDGADNINGEFGNDGVVGGAGDDVLGGGDGNDIVVGDDGDDVLFGETGNDAMNGGFGNDTVLGADGDDTIGGGAGDDNMLGGFDNDTIFGENGNDLITGGAGNDVLIGGGNDDVFVFAPGDGADTIADFFVGAPEDRIWFAGTDLHSFADVQAHAGNVGGNAVITYNGFFTVTLNGVSAAQLTAGDFIFT